MGERRSGQRRAYLRKFSATVIGGTSDIDKHYFREAAQRAHALSHRDLHFMKLYGLEPTAANEMARKARGERNPFLIETPRDKVLKRLDELLTNVNPLHHVRLIPKTLFMWWDDQGYCFLVKVDHSNNTCKRSLRYSTKAACLFAFKNNCVKWK